MTVFWRFIAMSTVLATAAASQSALGRANQPLGDITDLARDVATAAARTAVTTMSWYRYDRSILG